MADLTIHGETRERSVKLGPASANTASLKQLNKCCRHVKIPIIEVPSTCSKIFRKREEFACWEGHRDHRLLVDHQHCQDILHRWFAWMFQAFFSYQVDKVLVCASQHIRTLAITKEILKLCHAKCLATNIVNMMSHCINVMS